MLSIWLLPDARSQNALNYNTVRTTNASLVLDKYGNSLSFPLSNIIANNLVHANSAVLPIGFDFYFMGKRYTHFMAAGNGAMALALPGNSTDIFAPASINDLTRTCNYPASTDDAVLLAPFWDVLRTPSFSDFAVRMKMNGSYPNRILAVEWRVRISSTSTSSLADGVFQVRLYETTGDIEYIYGKMAIGTGSSTVWASIGFTAGTTDNSFKALKNLSTYEFTSLASEEPLTEFLVNSSTAQTLFALSSTADGNRSRFTFSPPPATGNFSQLFFSNSTLSSVTLNWTDNISNESQFAVYRSTDNINFDFVGSANANTNSFSVSDLNPSTQYFWKVMAITEGNATVSISNQHLTAGCSMQGVYKIGPGGDFMSIKQALDTLNVKGAVSHVILELNQSYDAVVEAFPIQFKKVGCASGAATITLRPEAGANALKISTNLNLATFHFSNASNYILDGRPGGIDTTRGNLLAIENLNTTNSAIVVENASRQNTFRYLNIRGRNNEDTSGVFRIYAPVNSAGNDSIKIEYNHFSNATANLYPRNLFYISGKITGINNDLQVLHNNFSNHRLPSGSSIKKSAAIHIADNNNRCLVRGNSFFQAAPTDMEFSFLSEYYEVYLSTTSSGSNHLIDSNYLGGTGPRHTGVKQNFYSQADYRGIYVNTKPGSLVTVSHNSISNINYRFTDIQKQFAGIYFEGPSNGRIHNNLIGSTSSDTAIIIATGFQQVANFNAISGVSNLSIITNDSLVVHNNTIAGITAPAAQTGEVQLYPINMFSFKNCNIRNNTIGSTTSNTSITNYTNNELNGIRYYDAFNTAGQGINILIANNTISGMSCLSTGVWNYLYGIRVADMASPLGNITIRGNTIQNLFTASNRDGTGNLFSGIAGITTENPLTSISENTIKNLANLPQASSTLSISGIDVAQFNLNANTRSVEVSRNKIFGLGGATSNGVRVNGIRIGNGNALVAANMIRLGTNVNGENINTPHLFSGIRLTNSFHVEVINNTVAINGQNIPNNPSGFSSYALYSNIKNSSTATIMNNILVNKRSNVSTAPGYHHYAIGTDTGFTAVNHQLQTNLYLVNGTNTMLGRHINTSFDSLRFWQSAILKDNGSIFGDPHFVSLEGAENVFDLHLQSPTPAESGGTFNSAVLFDFDGEPYTNSGSPEIGADGGNFVAVDLLGPQIIINQPLPTTGDITDRILTNVTILDPLTGVDNFLAENRPAIWYRKKNGSTLSNWAYNFGTIESGTLNNGTWQFPINYSLLNIAPLSGDTIEYYIVAQDTAQPFNIGYSPFAGALHSSTNVQITAPTAPLFYTLKATMLPLISVGPGQPYTNFTGNTGLFSAINESGGLSSNTTVTITGNLTETGQVALNGYKFNGYNLLVKPAAATVYDIRNQTTAVRTFGLDGVKRLTIDGSYNGSGKFLQFVNTNESSNGAVFHIYGNCDSVSIRNCIIAASTTDTLSTANIVIGSGINRNIILEQNVISNNSAFVAYKRLTGTGLLSLSSNNEMQIFNNHFTDFGFYGINLRKVSSNCVIDSNHFFLKDTVALWNNFMRFVRIGEGGNHNIRNNYFGGTLPFCGGQPFRINSQLGSWDADGIRCLWIHTNTTDSNLISGNRFSNFRIPYNMYSASFIAIDVNGSGRYRIQNNLIGSETQVNSILSGAGNGYPVYNVGIFINGTGQTIADSNTIANINDSYYADDMTVTGIRNSEGTFRENIISNNHIHHLYSASNGSHIYYNSGTIPITGIDSRNLAHIVNNSIHHLYSTDLSGSEVYSSGIYATDRSTTDTSRFGTIERNRIYEIHNPGWSSGITGLKVTDGKWIIVNNQVLLTNSAHPSAAVSLMAIATSEFVPGEKKVLYNTFALAGHNGNSNEGSITASIYTTKGMLYNNIFYNGRLGNSQHSAFATYNAGIPGTGFDSTNSNHNLFITRDSLHSVINSFTPANTLNAWRNLSGADRQSYWYHADTLALPANYFIDTTGGNLNLNTLNPYSWTANGKGRAMPGVSGDFDADNVRSTLPANGSTDIGSDEFDTNTQPPALRISGNHVPGGTDSLMLGERLIALINWGNTGTLPVLGNVRYYSGVWPNDSSNAGSISGAQTLNSWWDVPAVGGSGYSYNVSFFFDSSILGNIANPLTMQLHKKEQGVNGTWQALLPTIVDVSAQSITATGLTSFSEFTATSADHPLAFAGEELCRGNSTSFSTFDIGAGFTYQWQVDEGSGFVNLVNDVIYSGATTTTLTLNTPPSSYNGNLYRCITNTGSTQRTGATSSLKINNHWKGTVGNNWNDPLNWSCNSIPDANTNVIIRGGASIYPLLSQPVSCKKLLLLDGATVQVTAGTVLTITGK